jgi:transposase
MIDYETYRRIQHLKDSEGLTLTQIARELSLDVRTVRQWLDEPQFRPRKTLSRPSKLDPYKHHIKQLLEKHPYSVVQVFQQLREAGYDGGISIVKDYVRLVRPARPPAFLTLHFAPGECAQVDWGQYGSVKRR